MEVLALSLTVIDRIQLKDEKNLLVQGLPSTIEKQFAKLSFAKNVTPLLRARKIDFALIFAINHKQLKDILSDVIPALHQEAKLWISYPKVASKIVSDLSRECKWDCLAQYNFEPANNVILDHVWCAVQFVRKANATPIITVNIHFAAIVDKSEERLNLPEDFQKVLGKNKKAKSFFNELPIHYRKEYLQWVTSARKNETRVARIESTMEKLESGKKTPVEK
jgi:hypothetical protein